jgi:hypothetical protein
MDYAEDTPTEMDKGKERLDAETVTKMWEKSMSSFITSEF